MLSVINKELHGVSWPAQSHSTSDWRGRNQTFFYFSSKWEVELGLRTLRLMGCIQGLKYGCPSIILILSTSLWVNTFFSLSLSFLFWREKMVISALVPTRATEMGEKVILNRKSESFHNHFSKQVICQGKIPTKFWVQNTPPGRNCCESGS